MSDAYDSAKSILTAHRDQLERVAQELLNRETLDEQTFKALLDPAGAGSAADEISRRVKPIRAMEKQARRHYHNCGKKISLTLKFGGSTLQLSRCL